MFILHMRHVNIAGAGPGPYSLFSPGELILNSNYFVITFKDFIFAAEMLHVHNM